MAIQQTFMHFHRLFCLSTLLFLARFGNAQENLIKNPSFEIHSQTPLSLGHYNFCTDNWNPYIFSSDYYSTEIPSTCSNFIPNNNFGNQICNDGEYYVGISLNGWNYFNSNYQPFRSDFVGGILSQELQKNKVYQFQFFISKAEKGIFKTNAIDLILTYDTLVDVNNYTPFGYKIWSEQIPMEDTVNWIKITTCFKAKGNEKAFAIGNFHSESEVIKIVAYDSTTSGEIDYRYLDNFSLIECPSCCPDQFEDEPLVFVYSNPSTFGNPGSLELWLHPNTTGILELYDEVGRLVAKETYSNFQNIFSLACFAKGMYQYVYQTSDGLIESGKVMVVE